MIKKNKENVLKLSLVILFFFILSVILPLTGDDWTWKTSVGMERFYKFFDDYNGRYISNMLEIGAVRIYIFRVALMTIFSTALIWLIAKISFEKNSSQYLLYGFILVLLMPITIFQQTLGWTAGYVNYVTSIVMALFFLYIFLKDLKVENTQGNWFINTTLFIVAIPSMLLVEHVTLYLVAISVLFNIMYYSKKRRISFKYLAVLLGFISGAVLMFTNEVYLKIFSGNDPYRTVRGEVGLLERATDIFIYQMNYHFNINNLALLVFFLISLLMILALKRKRNLLDYLFLSPLIINIIIVGINQKSFSTFRIGSDLYILTSLLFLLSIIGALLFIVKNLNRANNFYRILFHFGSAIFLTLPFLVITPYGGRAALASLIFFILMIIELYKYISRAYNLNFYKLHDINYVVLLAITIAVLLPIGMNKIVEIERDNLVKEHKQEDVITLPLMPYPEYHQYPDPKENVFMTKFYKKLHGVKQDTEFKFEPKHLLEKKP